MSISSKATGLRPGVCTSTTRPTSPYTGQLVYETDTGYLRVWDGSAWDYLSETQNDTSKFSAISRSDDVWVSAAQFYPTYDTQTFAAYGSGWPNVGVAIAFNDGSLRVNTAVINVRKTGTINIVYYFSGAGSGNFRLERYATATATGTPGGNMFGGIADTLNSAVTIQAYNGLATTTTGNISVTADNLLRVSFGRSGGDAADTSTNVCYFFGALIKYV